MRQIKVVSLKKLSNIPKVTVKKWFQAPVSLILTSESLGLADIRHRENLRLARRHSLMRKGTLS